MSLYLIIFGYQMSPFKTRAFTPYRSENSGLEDGDEACLEPRQKTCPEPCRRSSSLKLNKSPTSLGRGSTGFTLVEILITITIVGILSTVTVVIINPTQLYKQSRDSRRISDLNTLNLAAGAAQSEFGTSVLGNKNTIYVSVPDTISTCDNLGLPQLPSGYSYHCADAPSLYKTDGSGWLPINLEGTNSSVSHLPVDPVNSVSSGLYYTYSTNNSYELTARPESVLYFIGGEKDVASSDGGPNNYLYEVGNNLNLYTGGSIILNGSFNQLTTPYTPGWDVSLNGNYKPTVGFSPGYNGGVQVPGIGYHAHANPTAGFNGGAGVEEIDQNCQYGYCHRWLGINYGWSAPATSMGWKDGTKITVQFLAKVNTTGKQVAFGLYHYSSSAGIYTFTGAWSVQSLAAANKWQVISQTFTVTPDWEISSHSVSLYIYGHYGTEGTLAVDDASLTYVK